MECCNYKHYFLNKDNSDVTLIIDGTKIPAHRSILSERCEYFKAMFSNDFVEAKSDKIILKETNLKAFKLILNFIYCGDASDLFDWSCYTVDENFKLYTCAKFFMIDKLVSSINDYLREKISPTELLNAAIMNTVNEFISYSTDEIQKNAPFKFDMDILKQLSPETMKHLLKLHLNTTESAIFEALVAWMRANPDYSSLFPKLLEHLDLYLLEKEQLNILFEPPQLVDPVFLQDLLHQQKEQAKNVQKIEDKNIINGINGLRIADGYIEEATVSPEDEKKHIIIDLKQSFLMNCFKITLLDDIYYTVSVSVDMRDWEQVIDRYDYKSVGLQVLYFNERAVRFIKITSIGYNFVDISTDIEAIYSTDPLEVDPETTLPIPKYNLFPEMIETDDGNRYDSDCDNDNHEYEHTGDNNLYGNRIVLKLPQPYMIHSVKFWLWEESSYEIEVSTSEEGDWTEVYSERDVSGWRTATFDRQPVMFIKIVGESSDSGYFTLSALQCPAT